ncbi:hypothetical protein H1V43_05865 [Streptomyces sp. PSKA54]|uniref:Uncharacterized protein n=1 Tax=Streptomyces himalayensis subsp. aureolus TaxID=2758039 RepID=A0A7W2HEH8_9ACTN|nr:hypothetical protein [Streptomyces himalayensis]MBA4860912.1 hypothetical protein [Streptomyces himalayensis subsp. aureolus]
MVVTVVVEISGQSAGCRWRFWGRIGTWSPLRDFELMRDRAGAEFAEVGDVVVEGARGDAEELGDFLKTALFRDEDDGVISRSEGSVAVGIWGPVRRIM